MLKRIKKLIDKGIDEFIIFWATPELHPVFHTLITRYPKYKYHFYIILQLKSLFVVVLFFYLIIYLRSHCIVNELCKPCLDILNNQFNYTMNETINFNDIRIKGG